MKLYRYSLSPAAFTRVLSGAAIAAVPLASFLEFSVQPLFGKLLLPAQGGAASTWLGTVLYFQITLLLGFAWAAWLLQRRPRLQVAATMGLALAALLGSRLSWVQDSQGTGIGGVLLTLALSTLPAMILLFSAGPLMLGWLRGRGRPVPLHLYAFSNAGGIAAMVLYPFTIERAVGLSDQMFLWRGLLWVLAELIVVAGLCFIRTPEAGRPAPGRSELIPARQIVKWTGLSALTCLGMLGATHHIAAEIGSNPLAWIGPFSAYLFSFLVVFSPGWQPRFTLACLGWLAVSLTGFMFYKGVSYNPVNGPAAWWLLSLTAAGSFFGNGLLRESRPDERSPLFYLMVAAGGVAGSLFASLGAPVLFLRPSELLVASFVLLTFGFLRLAARRDGLTVAIVILIVAAPVVGLVWQQTRAEAAGTLSVRRFRNIHGYKMLQSQENGLVLRSETTTHGTQITTPPEARRRPTLYYTESTGLGRLIAERQEAQASIKVAVIGLGAGTIAAYARPADQVDFWELDPQVIHIARDLFTFVSDSPGQVHIAQEDGRKGLETSHTDYDAIVLDTYAGSSIPAHLLTREAMATYLKLLEKRDGVLAVHATNRYSTLFPLVGATAHSFGCMVLNVVTEIGESAKERDWDFTSTQYILVGRPAGLRGLVRWLPAAEDGGRVKRLVTVYAPEPSGSAGPWTDDRQATLDALDLRHFLSGE